METKTKLLLKILIGTAWLDGIIYPQERIYLRETASKWGLGEDADLKNLLSELKPVSPDECYGWLEEYLGDNPTQNDYDNLLGAISALVYSDGDVQLQEARLLTKLQGFDLVAEPQRSIFDKILMSIRNLYRQTLTSKSE
ncbi:MAG: TerB family tellurite resistance protein [Chlorogloea purpurea SAG 13.99]|nr:TerB family tellurite resistance protein [Chlorogloea purpurea SAG 13.99]